MQEYYSTHLGLSAKEYGRLLHCIVYIYIYFHADKIYGNIVKMADKSFSRRHRPSFHTFPCISNIRNMLFSFHRRRNQGGQGGHGPPRFQNIRFRPPQISTPKINQHWLEIISLSMYDSLSCATFMRLLCYRGGDIFMRT